MSRSPTARAFHLDVALRYVEDAAGGYLYILENYLIIFLLPTAWHEQFSAVSAALGLHVISPLVIAIITCLKSPSNEFHEVGYKGKQGCRVNKEKTGNQRQSPCTAELLAL